MQPMPPIIPDGWFVLPVGSVIEYTDLSYNEGTGKFDSVKGTAMVGWAVSDGSSPLGYDGIVIRKKDESQPEPQNLTGKIVVREMTPPYQLMVADNGLFALIFTSHPEQQLVAETLLNKHVTVSGIVINNWNGTFMRAIDVCGITYPT